MEEMENTGGTHHHSHMLNSHRVQDVKVASPPFLMRMAPHPAWEGEGGVCESETMEEREHRRHTPQLTPIAEFP